MALIDTTDNLAKQLAMTAQTWDALQSEGVREGDDLEVEFVYLALDERQAAAWVRAIDSVELETVIEFGKMRTSGFRSRSAWIVRTKCQVPAVSLNALTALVKQSVLDSADCGVVFDGWGVELL